jgi:hypothetical protein
MVWVGKAKLPLLETVKSLLPLFSKTTLPFKPETVPPKV